MWEIFVFVTNVMIYAKFLLSNGEVLSMRTMKTTRQSRNALSVHPE